MPFEMKYQNILSNNYVQYCQVLRYGLQDMRFHRDGNEGFYLKGCNAVSSVENSMDYKVLYSRSENSYDSTIIYNVPEIGFTLVSG
jgi:hypothetical protein